MHNKNTYCNYIEETAKIIKNGKYVTQTEGRESKRSVTGIKQR